MNLAIIEIMAIEKKQLIITKRRIEMVGVVSSFTT